MDDSPGLSPQVTIARTDLLSTRGSNRATAYPQVSNKIVRTRDQLFVTWLDQPATVQVATYDLSIGRWTGPITLGEGQDNHAGAALVIDPAGFLYAIFGPHHGPFQFRQSLRPYDASEWGPTERFGINCTYPSLVCASDGTLHLVHRGGRRRWRLLYRRRPPGQRWTEPVELADPCFDGYTHFWHSLALGADGTLHLAFSINTGSPFMGRAVAYLRSTDSGDTWTLADGTVASLPITPCSPGLVECGDGLQMTPSNVVVSASGQPWLAIYHRERVPQGLTLWHYDGAQWRSRELAGVVRRACSGYEPATVTTMTFDAAGRLYLAAVIQRAGEDHGGQKDGWGEPGDRVVVLTSDDQGETFAVLPVSAVDRERPNWLATIERPHGPEPVGVPCLMYTHGGSGVHKEVDQQGTDVVFVQLEQRERRPARLTA